MAEITERIYEVLHSGSDLEAFATWADNQDEERVEAFEAYCDITDAHTFDEILDEFEERYEGWFATPTELAEQFIDSIGGPSALDKNTIENYFDYEKFGRDLRHDYYEVDGYYFRAV